MVEIKSPGEIEAIQAAGRVVAQVLAAVRAAAAPGVALAELDETARSADGSRAAHIEHTIAVTAGGPLILTTP